MMMGGGLQPAMGNRSRVMCTRNLHHVKELRELAFRYGAAIRSDMRIQIFVFEHAAAWTTNGCMFVLSHLYEFVRFCRQWSLNQSLFVSELGHRRKQCMLR